MGNKMIWVLSTLVGALVLVLVGSEVVKREFDKSRARFWASRIRLDEEDI